MAAAAFTLLVTAGSNIILNLTDYIFTQTLIGE
ncbi:hypothetical protein COLO4_36136 [Corchorus olitorius]|uniref:Uncharacterized protein n=1 Tax=Corchorus olitorius TaxID=93759 RepID=A0A1R3GAS2_9ROSI|nr:hypothetical protein COLO4_36136 [Corchorus olitorius]